jgi:hypothetical protein
MILTNSIRKAVSLLYLIVSCMGFATASGAVTQEKRDATTGPAQTKPVASSTKGKKRRQGMKPIGGHRGSASESRAGRGAPTPQTTLEAERNEAVQLVMESCRLSNNHSLIRRHRARIDSMIDQGYDRNIFAQDIYQAELTKFMINVNNIAAGKLGTFPLEKVTLVRRHFPSALRQISVYETSLPPCLPCFPEKWEPGCR